MYIRWRSYELANKSRSIRAEVVEAYRDKVGGQSRVRVLSYLASIREKSLPVVDYREQFWKQVEEKISLLNLPEGEERKLIESISRRVPRPISPAFLPPSAPEKTDREPVSVVGQREQSTEELLMSLTNKLCVSLPPRREKNTKNT